MNNRVALHLNGLEGASTSDLIELIREKDQALQAVTEVNWQLTFERDQARREADAYKARCIKFQVDEKRRQKVGGQA
ncbi:hypothetical protein HUB98_26370 [Paenibacillus barcinonensis]|uniref:Uncharacterized protein n=1 Tax=Paenibacillus barcinonensis TaxID=198119 RepID=A0A2V4VGM8_PAEBA|nr:hypothetical protein [Paenibacillus barcinonensis]PYE52512.1 hypothetical protein DFQ00_101450 [Paenibacillus barcinonensis]QKS59329.1 hypothetical protein HUB98_26080 [Paenibacillus barcinonensis]QKS59383.1 hypothetical protein HUB98_26370 [Paenibacillus barcinonensis]